MKYKVKFGTIENGTQLMRLLLKLILKKKQKKFFLKITQKF